MESMLPALTRKPRRGSPLDAGLPVDQITYINGTVYRTGSLDEVYDYDLLPSWDDLTADKDDDGGVLERLADEVAVDRDSSVGTVALTCSNRIWTPSPGIAW